MPLSERADQLISRLRMLDGKIALFSHGKFGGVLAARWIGLPLIEARHFPLGTASFSLLSFNPYHPEVPVIALWNAAPYNMRNTASFSPIGDTMTLKQVLDRWENEGGEILQPQPKKESV